MFFYYLGPLMFSECHFQGIAMLGQLLYLNQDPVREMTIGHLPQCEEKTRETLVFPRNLSLVA